MESFLEKLKKGMNIEGTLVTEEATEEKTEEKEPIKEKPKKTRSKKAAAAEKSAEKKTKIEVKKLSIGPTNLLTEKERFLGEPGQLTIDLYQTADELVLQSAIAGVKSEDLDISIENGILTIRGYRAKPTTEQNIDYFTQECFWGPFIREVVLPVEVDAGRYQASLQNGILTIRLPKIEREKKRKIIIQE